MGVINTSGELTYDHLQICTLCSTVDDVNMPVQNISSHASPQTVRSRRQVLIIWAEFISHFKSCENYPNAQLVFLPSTFDLKNPRHGVEINPSQQTGLPYDLETQLDWLTHFPLPASWGEKMSQMSLPSAPWDQSLCHPSWFQATPPWRQNPQWNPKGGGWHVFGMRCFWGECIWANFTPFAPTILALFLNDAPIQPIHMRI